MLARFGNVALSPSNLASGPTSNPNAARNAWLPICDQEQNRPGVGGTQLTRYQICAHLVKLKLLRDPLGRARDLTASGLSP